MNGYRVVAEFQDEGITGTRANRPKIQEVIEFMRMATSLALKKLLASLITTNFSILKVSLFGSMAIDLKIS